ncbi:TIGR03792 family protein [Synechococcus elongatus]|uniref:ABM domain-containing protein n=2 Tax=Synechococcus elongatus TaxID=32046 RepID=Q31QY4_SYNE7|nr:TIGR03792 family protein [Synechococcus elongatus]ABB56535.1 hypothetical protein Synpcc7942_0503 [Synechococcus elongatus PCC 7942 = FACHB-805]AJD56423.1 hypothetical protein M744_00445 [Synechococcus elongatus UTEX 2973]MBD2588883.1 TIGR03792 family protein [Synechococcus elongatus FACHB-242]MBD2689949.1 TIGR03792 family protein [Synechococcus elongatus FACHB-1061]MBD2706920.1 TIGR03792 family protein [Synechococcus elongatus PCC 7942 = FACHB-805]
MVVEWLKFAVPATEQAAFLAADAAVWTPLLSRYPGYLRKEVWQDPSDRDHLVMVIHWQSREQWKSIPEDVLIEGDRRFQAQLGREYPLVEAQEFAIVPQPEI